MATTPRRLLLIAYQFPPVGGAGVQRVAKFCKYLPQHQWSVSVLTVSNPSVPLVDNSMGADIPAETIIRRAVSREPSYRLKESLSQPSPSEAMSRRWWRASRQAVRKLAMQILQPDAQILWVPAAIRAGRALLREVSHDAILVSAPPFSSFLVGAALGRRTGLPLVLDYRDEWGISNRYWENRPHNRWTQFVQSRLQRWVIRHAQTLIATTELSAKTLRQEAEHAGRTLPVCCLFNGFDPADLESLHRGGAPPRDAPYRLSHVGTLWRLTSARPLLEAVERLASHQPELAARLEIELVGRCTAPEELLVERFRCLPCRLRRCEYVDHLTAIEIMGSSQELCLLLAEVPGAERVVPAKTFEYLATGRRLLTIAPPGELRNIVASFPGVATFAPSDVSGICEHLAQAIEASTPGSEPTAIRRDVTRFDRREQAGELAKILDGLVS